MEPQGPLKTSDGKEPVIHGGTNLVLNMRLDLQQAGRLKEFNPEGYESYMKTREALGITVTEVEMS